MREALPREASDAAVVDYAFHHALIVITFEMTFFRSRESDLTTASSS